MASGSRVKPRAGRDRGARGFRMHALFNSGVYCDPFSGRAARLSGSTPPLGADPCSLPFADTLQVGAISCCPLRPDRLPFQVPTGQGAKPPCWRVFVFRVLTPRASSKPLTLTFSPPPAPCAPADLLAASGPPSTPSLRPPLLSLSRRSFRRAFSSPTPADRPPSWLLCLVCAAHPPLDWRLATWPPVSPPPRPGRRASPSPLPPV